jgi:hypothetical protein
MVMNQPNASKSSGQFHAVRFYKDSDSLCRLVARFLGEGFAEALPAIVIATSAHRAGIVNELRAQGIDVERLQSGGDLVLLDADDVLTQSMVDGLPDGSRFHDLMIANIERVCKGREDCVVRAYGEMVDVLWKRGLTAAATRLELLWNQLAQTHRFSLLCGYSMGNFYKDAAQDEICRHHTHVLRNSDDAAVVHYFR